MVDLQNLIRLKLMMLFSCVNAPDGIILLNNVVFDNSERDALYFYR